MDGTPLAQEKAQRINNEGFCTAQEAISRTNRHLTQEENMIHNQRIDDNGTSESALISGLYKELQK